jgi:transposase
MKTIAEVIGGAQALLDINLGLQACFEEKLGNEYKTFLQLLRIIESVMPPLTRARAATGRRPYQYLPFFRSQLAKSVFGIEKTSHLLQRLKGEPNLRLLCGFDKVPCKATFSNMFSCLAKLGIVERIFDALVAKAHEGKVVYHVNRDSTAISARERVEKKKKEKARKQHKKRGRPPKTAMKCENPKATRIEKQIKQDAKTSLGELDRKAAWGCKKNSQGNVSFWKGYKLHLDVSDTGFPLSACVTGANVHDSQVAIPLEKMTEQKVTFCYSLMDSAYDAEAIDQFIRSRGRVPIIDPNKRGNSNRPPLDPAKQERFKIRSAVERANSHLKDSLLPKAIYVKGYEKISFVLMVAVLCLAGLKYLQFIC